MMTELLSHSNDRVVRAMSGALRNLAIDARNRDLLGESPICSEARGTGRKEACLHVWDVDLVFVCGQVNTRCLTWWPTCPAAVRVSRCERSLRRRWCQY